jgi:EF hand
MTRRHALPGSLGVSLMFVDLAAAQKDGIGKHPDPAARATENVKELLLLMDTDKNGKITKEEWMEFMSAEFDGLDLDKRS